VNFQQRNLIHTSSKCFDNDTLSFEEKLKRQKTQLYQDEREGLEHNTRLAKAWEGGHDEGISRERDYNKPTKYENSFKKSQMFEDDESDFLSNRAPYEDRSERTRRRRNSLDDNDSDNFYGESYNRRQNRGPSRNFRFDQNDDGDDWDNNYSRQQDSFYNTDDITPTESVDLPPLESNFFKPTAALLERDESQVSEYLKAHNISVSGGNIPSPLQEFSDHQFPEKVLSSLQDFTAPTPIQAMGWSVALSGRDLIGIGQVS